MFDILVEATFCYRGHSITAQRIDDALTEKNVCWYGLIDNKEDIPLAKKSLEQFVESWRWVIDSVEDEPTNARRLPYE